MKNIVIGILVVALILINILGCQSHVINHESLSCDNSTDQLETTKGAIDRVASPGNCLTTFDPEREIYFTCEDMNMDLDIYFWNTWRPAFDFYIISLDKLDMSSLKVTIPIESTYSVSSSQCNVWRGTEYAAEKQGLFDGRVNYNECFPYYLYQVIRGVDFKRAFDLSKEMDKAEYYRFIDSELMSYQQLDEEDIPLFYAYKVSICFDYECKVAESFSEMVVSIEGKDYQFDIGEVSLIPDDKINTMELSEEYWNEAGEASVGQLHYFYNDGLACAASAFRVTPKEKMTLTGLKAYGSDVGVLDIFVTIHSETPISFQWDGKSSIEINEGDMAEIDIIFREDEAQILGYNIQTFFELDFVTEAESACLMKAYVLSPCYTNVHELFAIVFMGVDMESYYRDYYYPIYEPWRSEYIK